ncbi:TRAP transporter small permease subunit [Halodurantibacterium flavum]|uniref:TRAP transporter small permease protein n=1 Tax=Halodurantibacterium flavum TaxID=1382802 RepID=A0ABW4S858_9RHOB
MTDAMDRMPRAIRLYVRWTDGLSQVVGIIAMYLIFAMVAVLLLDAITRNVINIPLHWCIEAAQFMLTAYYFAGGAYTLKEGAHARMDVFYERLTERGRARMDLLTAFCLLFYLGVLLWGSISSTLYAIEYDQRNFSMWNPSMIPIKVVMVCAIVLMILQAIAMIFKDWARLRQGAPA